MKPLLLLAIAAVAAGAMGTGFLNNNNGINLWIQEFGVGEGDIGTPVTHAQVDFVIDQIAGQNPGTFENVIKDCVLTLNDDVTTNGQIFCKLTDWHGDIISEGKTTLLKTLDSFTPVNIVIDTTTGGNNSVIDVKDVIIVVQGGDGQQTMSGTSTMAP